MRLFMVDVLMYRSRLFGSRPDEFGSDRYPWWPSSPQTDLAEARKLIEKCSYWRRKEELEDAETVFGPPV
ncbi:MAG: hypothetical protein JWO08_2242 [Verrucomicrobiaceae bacterium]|nr:hypothetical protein [Verrucomicrobiaceae bacterium]